MDATNFPYRRIIVVGTTSSGKSTLAARLAAKLGLDYVELDALYWQPNWVGTPDDEFKAKVVAATRGERWAVAGNYSRTRPITWPRAEAVVWLDYSLPVIFWQLLTRTIRRITTRELLWGTNVERLWPHLKLWSDKSLFKWLFKTYWRRKREYPQLFALPEYAHLEIFRFGKPSETRQWLAKL
ncbi:MAG: adenylate kinase [Chloroflexi bacterium]|nr:adenylate kinase [Chloroflexota bacterium]